jgi:16S rRNA processing protein RimM
VDDAERRPARKSERGSGGRDRASEPRFLTVGQVVGAHGVGGELKVTIMSDDPQRFARLQRVFLGPDDENPVACRVESTRLHGGQVLIKLEGCDDRSAAQARRGTLLFVPLEEAIPLAEGEYYEHQIVGLEVWTTAGEFLGKVVDILYTRANEVYVVQDEDTRREVLLPAIEEVVQAIDLEAGRIVVTLIEGLS